MRSTIPPPDLTLHNLLKLESFLFQLERSELVLPPSPKISNPRKCTDPSEKLELIESMKERESREQRMLRPPKSEEL